MAGNSFGNVFRVTTFGESHGTAIGCVIDGCPPGMKLSESDIQHDLDRRKPGTSKFVTQRREDDIAQILSGVFEETTTGTPLTIIIYNKDQRSVDYKEIANKFRPGHADYSYFMKYGLRDYRGGGRSSARETAARVAAGAVAKKWLQNHCNIKIFAYVSQIGVKKVDFVDEELINQNPFFIANLDKVDEIGDYLDSIRKSLDSIGAKIKIVAQNVPPSLGEPVFDRLDADIAKAMMSINAVKAVAIGDGFDVVFQRGSFHSDEIAPGGFLSNHAGGILGGISTGQDIDVSIALKPTSSIAQARKTVDVTGSPVSISTGGRHDPCVGIRAVPIAEAMLALVLMDHLLLLRAQCSDIPFKEELNFYHGKK